MKRKRKNLGASEGEHLERLHDSLKDHGYVIAKAERDIEAGRCDSALRALGESYKRYGQALGHAEGIPDIPLRKKIVDAQIVPALVRTDEARISFTSRCALRKGRS